MRVGTPRKALVSLLGLCMRVFIRLNETTQCVPVGFLRERTENPCARSSDAFLLPFLFSYLSAGLLHSIDSPILKILGKSLQKKEASSLQEDGASSHSSSVGELKPFRSDELNVAVYVHHVVASGGGDFFGGGTAEVAHAIPELDAAIDRIEEEIRRTITTNPRTTTTSGSLRFTASRETPLSGPSLDHPLSLPSSTSLASLLLFLGGAKEGEFEGIFDSPPRGGEDEEEDENESHHGLGPPSFNTPTATTRTTSTIDCSSNEDLYRLYTLVCDDCDRRRDRGLSSTTPIPPVATGKEEVEEGEEKPLRERRNEGESLEAIMGRQHPRCLRHGDREEREKTDTGGHLHAGDAGGGGSPLERPSRNERHGFG